MGVTPTIWLAFLAGLLSFVSPCTLPLYPSYISFISGVSYQKVGSGMGTGSSTVTRSVRGRALAHASFFVLGFSVIFIALGASASAIGLIFNQYRTLIGEIGGVIVVAMGLILLGLWNPSVLMRDAKWTVKTKPAGYLGAFVIGVSFAAGWTPCIGPILASVIAIAASSQVSGMVLMSFYAVGFAIPFLILAVTLGSVRWLQKYSQRISQVGGAILIVMGLLLVTNKMTDLVVWVTRLFGGYSLL